MKKLIELSDGVGYLSIGPETGQLYSLTVFKSYRVENNVHIPATETTFSHQDARILFQGLFEYFAKHDAAFVSGLLHKEPT